MKYTDYVNIKQGTKSQFDFSNGNTLPLVQLPNAMIAFAQQTNSKSGWWYEPETNFIEGIRITHQLSPWIADYGNLLITPQSDKICDTPYLAHSGMDYKKCVMKPHYLKTEFLRSKCIFELVPTERAAKIKLSFGRNCVNYLSLFSIDGATHFDVTDNKVIGYTYNSPAPELEGFRMYFEISVDAIDVENTYIVENDTDNAVIHIALNKTEVELDLAISYISNEQARLNANEVNGKAFSDLLNLSESIWNKYLGRIKIKTDDIDKLKTFYSCMYRAFTHPHKAFEINDNGENVHFSPFTGRVHRGKRYTGNCYWDTYRTNFALYSMIDRQLYEGVLESLVCDYEESGWLPRCSTMGEYGCMPSTLIDFEMKG